MKKILVFVLFLSASAIYAQETTTIILVRHAEKMSDGSKDPELSEAGKSRAMALTKLLKEVKVDAIYSTGFKRTQNTVAPLAVAKDISVITYDAMKAEQIDEILRKFPGGTVVICGHSNTTPAIANILTGKEKEYKDFDDTDYDNILIVNLTERGKSKVTWLTY